MSKNDPAQPPALEIIQEHMSDASMPPEAQENIRQHYDNLTRLVEDLKSLGMDQQAIDEHVLEIFKEYESKLADNIQRIRDSRRARPVHQAR